MGENTIAPGPSGGEIRRRYNFSRRGMRKASVLPLRANFKEQGEELGLVLGANSFHAISVFSQDELTHKLFFNHKVSGYLSSFFETVKPTTSPSCLRSAQNVPSRKGVRYASVLDVRHDRESLCAIRNCFAYTSPLAAAIPSRVSATDAGL